MLLPWQTALPGWVLVVFQVVVVVYIVVGFAASGQVGIPVCRPAEDGAEKEAAGGESGRSDGGGC